jgi:transcriptional regulator with XRE-family HTH domain
MYLRKNIKFLRESTGKTQKDLSDAIGMKSHQIIGKYETGKATPPIDVLEEIAKYFGVDLQSLMFGNLETGEKVEVNQVVDKNRMQRLLEKELDRLEALEQKIKANGQIMETIRKIDPDLAKAIEES